MRGTFAAWNKLPIADRNADTLYFISDANDGEAVLYLGNKLIAGGSADVSAVTLDDLSDVVISALGEVTSVDFLVYDQKAGAWVNKNPRDLAFEGATSLSMGEAGLVPAPATGQENYFLRGDGTWAPATCAAALYEATLQENETHDDAIARVVGSNTVLNGDVAVIKELIAGDKYQHTSYFFSQSVKKWVAMDGDYDASNVYFNDDFIFTEAIGTVTIPSSGSIKVDAEGKNVQEFFASLFASARDPEVTDPSGSISYDGTSTSYEVGTKVSPKYKTTFSAGSYEFGPATGITATAYAVVDSNNVTKTTATGTMPEITITDTTRYNIGVTISHSAGANPVNNIGAEVSDLAIGEGTLTYATGNITGYRASFAGIDNGTGALTTDLIRGLTNKWNYNAKKEITLTAGDDTTRFIIAVPASNTRSGLSSAIITSSMNATATNDYKYSENAVKVEGAGDYEAVDYDVWVYQPAKITSGETHKITLA
jgi:hypothetical protein